MNELNIPAIMIKLFFTLSILTLSITGSYSQNSAVMQQSDISPMQQNAPVIGAEIFIEPGQTAEEIDTWYRLMKENGMTICRIRMFETYMHRADGTWDFSLFDLAYRAAEKYNIKVWGNLFPATAFIDVGGFKFPHNQQHLNSIADYIKNLVTHFRQFKSCYGWVLINEPGSGKLPDEEFTRKMFEEWKQLQPAENYTSKGYNILTFDEERFLVDYNTWFLNWLKEEVYKYDPGSHLHVNNHAIFQNVAEYNFPAWRKLLTSLGGSSHASWHFGYFKRSQYSVALSANCEIIRSGAGPLPWLMTEIQGGNNTYSGFNAMCPTSEEIDQWLWTVIASGGKGAIFWTFNPRASGFEAGEWAMIDFQNNPSDRLTAASSVAKVISENNSLFANAKPVESGINILYTRESLWMEKKLQTGGDHYEGRDVGGVMKSALSYFEALGEMGMQSNLKEMDEFDFSRSDYTGTVIILAHQVSIPSRYWKNLDDFVSKGGKLMVDGLTAYYDEHAHCIMKTGFPLEELFGADIREFKLEGNLFEVSLNNPPLSLPGHCWRGTMAVTTARAIGFNNHDIVATRNTYGKGEVLWIPSLVGLAGRIKGYEPLSALLNDEVKTNLSSVPFRFKVPATGMLMKTLQSGDSYITVIINKGSGSREVELVNSKNRKPSVLFSDKKGKIENNKVSLAAEETIVIRWK
jgi:beta-galactosidase